MPSELQEIINRLFSNLPEGLDERQERFGEMELALREKFSEHLAPVLNKHLETLLTPEEKLSAVLALSKKFGLTVVDPSTGKPARLVLERPPSPQADQNFTYLTPVERHGRDSYEYSSTSRELAPVRLQPVTRAFEAWAERLFGKSRERGRS